MRGINIQLNATLKKNAMFIFLAVVNSKLYQFITKVWGLRFYIPAVDTGWWNAELSTRVK